jgi:hypothetical protein
MQFPTKIKNSLFLILAVNFLLCVSVLAQQNQQLPLLDVPKGKFVVLKIPSRLIGFERVSFWSGNVNYGAIIEQSKTGGLMIGGLNDWKRQGWTLMRQLSVEKVSREKNFTLVELRDPLYNVKLRFDNSVKDINTAFREVAFVGLLTDFEASDFYKKEVVEKVLPQVFTGSLESISTARKLNLLKELKYIDSAIKSEKYKGDNYLSIDVGGDTEVFNTIRVDQPHRIGHSLNQRVLSYFKRIARIVKFPTEVDGIKISILIPYKNFVTETYLEPSYDRIEIYAPMDVIRQFADDELTNQEFVEESILLVNGNRMRIPDIESF